MSLDVYLHTETPTTKISSGIFIRENGEAREILVSEWNERFPEMQTSHEDFVEETTCVYSANITHNLNTMADAAGIYKHLWRPEEIEITKASQLIEPLKNGLVELIKNREELKKLNPENNWGSYEGLFKFVHDYLDACYKFPEATVSVSR